ncbi:FitA-like ribbon-helix-helix domain-containing protein [Ferrovibrio xuzhouensis]|uniref:Antitoxin FitA-like ribbon-helix-helix domain-containing protein n=1 Tax=Ferrovibrio xuzhouensis TaxID=1576914 RepID=A0ABV7VLZ6_9PROT
MVAICIRGLPAEAKALLRLRAARNGVSMEEEVRRILFRALLQDGPAGEAAGMVVDRGAVDGYPDPP